MNLNKNEIREKNLFSRFYSWFIFHGFWKKKQILCKFQQIYAQIKIAKHSINLSIFQIRWINAALINEIEGQLRTGCTALIIIYAFYFIEYRWQFINYV